VGVHIELSIDELAVPAGVPVTAEQITSHLQAELARLVTARAVGGTAPTEVTRLGRVRVELPPDEGAAGLARRIAADVVDRLILTGTVAVR
jgi:hypothetical protein